ncbi:chromate transporter [Halobacillus shinanisalinarum]|uniref:Chromate transporter n=1 Tax=Halobacillus shinanisalinarum TaxID=2932258 RepID=A0ABY4GWI4_9BACI|nr:chromate transporter [Halobacillus shinanisalinarum]UOQ91757.1 chromate transporter [Halobacillus shinanisalinarum]
MKTQWHLFVAFFRVGMLGYGGGPASIPLVHKEVVGKYQWMDDSDFGDLLALANTLPGPIATKMAGYIGYRVSGWIGLINAVMAVMIPTIFLMIVLLGSLTSVQGGGWVEGMTNAVMPVVGVMMAVLTWQFFNKARKGMGWVQTILFTVVALILLELLHVHPGIIIAALLAAAILRKEPKDEDEKGAVKGGDEG